MIDFRYHLVSIVAVFLALAIGIVLGSTELQGKTLDALRQTSNSLSSKLSAAQQERDSNAAQVAADQQFAAANEPVLLAKLLARERVVLVTEPGAQDGVVSGIEKAARDAGATVTGTIALQSKFNDTTGATESGLNSINGTIAATDGTTLVTGSDQQTANQQQAAQLMASAVVTKSSNSTAPSGLTLAEAQTLLNSYAQAGFISVSGRPARAGR